MNLTKKYPNWIMPSQYYVQEFPLNPKGEKFLLVQVDSCFLLCETMKKNPESFKARLDEDSKKIFESRCELDASYQAESN